MKRIFNITTKCLLTLVAAFSLNACITSEHEVNPGKEGDLILKFTSTIPAATQTRSFENQENTMNTVDILVFDNNGTKYAYRTYGTVDPEGNQSTIIRAKVLPTGENDKHSYVLFANLRSEIETLNLEAGTPKEEVMEMIKFEAWKSGETDETARQWNISATGTKYLPMWGDNDKTYEVNTSNDIEFINSSSDVVKMLRAVARVDVVFDDVTTFDHFLPTKIMVYRANQSGQGVPDPDNLEAGTFIAEEATLPTGVDNGKILYNIQAKDISKDDPERKFGLTSTIYLTESIIRNETTPLAPEDRTGILIGGVYHKDGNFSAGKETWYRLDFYHRKDDNTPATLVDILRNHHYKFTVTRIEGDGYPDPDKAAESEAINIDDYVLEWEEDFSMDDIWYDGHTMFGVSPRNITISPFGTEETPQVIRIVTNSKFTNVTYKYVPVDGDTDNKYVYNAGDLGYTPASQYSFLDEANVTFSSPTPVTIDGKTGVEYTFTFEVPQYKNTYNGPTPRKMQMEFTFTDAAGNVRMVVPATISQNALDWYVDDFFYVYEEKPYNRDYRTRKIHMYAKGNFENLMVRAAFKSYPGNTFYDWLGYRAVIGRIESGENPYKDVYVDYYNALPSWGQPQMLREIDEYSSTVIDLPRYGHYNFTTYEDLPWQYGFSGIGGISTQAVYYYHYFYSLDGGTTWQAVPNKAYADDPLSSANTHHLHNDFRGSSLLINYRMDRVPPYGFPTQPELSGDGQDWILQFSGYLRNLDETVSIYAVVEDDAGNPKDIVGRYAFTSDPNGTDMIVNLPVELNDTGQDRTIELYVSIGGEEEGKIRPYYLEYRTSAGDPGAYYYSVIQKAR